MDLGGVIAGQPEASATGTPDLSQAEAALRLGRVREVLPTLRRLAGHHAPALSRLVRLLVVTGNGGDALGIAQEAFERREYPLAEALAQGALDAGLQEAPAYYLLAACAAATGRERTAIDLARVGVALDPRPDRAQAELAGLYLKQGLAKEAIVAAESVSSQQRSKRLQEILGLAYAQAGRPDAARAVFRGLLAEDSTNQLAQVAMRRLAPPPLDRMLDDVAASLAPELRLLFARLRQGSATEAELEALLNQGGFRRVLVKALLRDLAERTRVGGLPLVRIGPAEICLDLATLDASPP